MTPGMQALIAKLPAQDVDTARQTPWVWNIMRKAAELLDDAQHNRHADAEWRDRLADSLAQVAKLAVPPAECIRRIKTYLRWSELAGNIPISGDQFTPALAASVLVVLEELEAAKADVARLQVDCTRLQSLWEEATRDLLDIKHPTSTEGAHG